MVDVNPEDLITLPIQSGIYTEASDSSSINRYKAAKNMRFFKEQAAKVGGWVKLISDTAFLGICRALLSWTDLTANRWLAIATHIKVYVTDGVDLFDITPLASTGTLGADPFETVSGSHSVTVTHVGHGVVVGQYVHFPGTANFAGLDFSLEWPVATVVDGDHFTFLHGDTASASAFGGGSTVVYQYEIVPGLADSTSMEDARVYSVDLWGEDFVLCPSRGALYIWITANGTSQRAQIMPFAPQQNLMAFVSEADRHLLSFGSYDASLGLLDPMLISWCSSENYEDWVATETNSAGNKRLDHGKRIACVIQSRNQFVVITDQTIYEVNFSGDDFVYNFIAEGETIEPASQNCGVDIGGIVYYMAKGQFIKYTGQIDQLPCDVHSFVFTVDTDRGFLGINTEQYAKVFCGRNKTKLEIIWFYCSAGSTEIDRCVAYSYEDGNPNWWLGTVSCTAFLDVSSLSDNPLGAHADGYIYVHESGVDAGAAALPYSLETYDLQTPNGSLTLKVRRVLPDCKRLVGTNHRCTLSGRKEPNGRLIRRAAVKFGETVRWIGAKIRARQVSLKIEGDSVGDDIALGVWRLDAKIEGKK